MKTMIAALALLLPAAAHADGWTTWTEQAAGTYTRTINLDGGRDYALAADIAQGADLVFRLTVSLAGTPIASLLVHYGDSVEGATFRAPKAAPYTLTLTIPPNQICDASYDCGVMYQIAQDCRADTRTLCKLPVDRSEPNRAWNYVKDDDWFRTTLRGRKRYEAWLHDPQGCVIAFRVLDTKGREVPSSTISHPSGDTSIRFTPPTSGTYFVAAEGVCESGGPDAGGPYGISLTAR